MPAWNPGFDNLAPHLKEKKKKAKKNFIVKFLNTGNKDY
jgi:hypothetical protein